MSSGTSFSSSDLLSDSYDTFSEEAQDDSSECTPGTPIRCNSLKTWDHYSSYRSHSKMALYNIVSVPPILKLQLRPPTSSFNYIWCSDYAEDILANLRDAERRRPRIWFKSPQIQHRPSLLLWMKSAAENLHLNRCTTHLAVYLLDVFMDMYKIIPTKLKLVALVSILLAAKMEERDHNIPKIMRLNTIAENQYSKQDFKNLEVKILTALNWNLLCPTASTYIECFASNIVNLEDFNNLNNSKDCNSSSPIMKFDSYSHFFVTMNNLILDLLEITMQDIRLMHKEPSIVAASCLATARKLFNMEPLWPQQLAILTGCEYTELEECSKAILKNKETVFLLKTNTEDSGFITDSDSSIEDEVFNPRKRRKLGLLFKK